MLPLSGRITLSCDVLRLRQIDAAVPHDSAVDYSTLLGDALAANDLCFLPLQHLNGRLRRAAWLCGEGRRIAGRDGFPRPFLRVLQQDVLDPYDALDRHKGTDDDDIRRF